MNKNIFSKSDSFKEEYCCSIKKIEKLFPIEGADFISYAEIDGNKIVVNKKDVSEGGIYIYASNETQLNSDFLSSNNLFSISNKEMNKDFEKIENLYSSNKEEALRICGFFERSGRVRMIRLKGIPSKGFIFPLSALLKWKDINISEDELYAMEGTDFDTVDGEMIVKAYVPFRKEKNPKNGVKKNEEIKYDRIDDPALFRFHYDTEQLGKHIGEISKDDKLCISVKMHGTSVIISKTNVRSYVSWPKRVIRLLIGKKPYDIRKGIIYSSRTVIRNSMIDKCQKEDVFYDDVYGKAAMDVKDFIEDEMTIYAEIIGFNPNGKPVQIGYDYGCDQGKFKIMPYRITKGKEEYNATKVRDWTLQAIEKNKDSNLFPLQILYCGTLEERYPSISYEGAEWKDEVVSMMKNDFGMEKNEPLCRNKVPREGIVIRKEDNSKEAYKLKSDKFYLRETKMIDDGNFNDMEAENTNY